MCRAALVTVSLLVVAACSGGDGDSAETASTTSAPAPSTTIPSETVSVLTAEPVPAGGLPPVLVGGPDGVAIAEAATLEPVRPMAVEAAVGDGGGGVVTLTEDDQAVAELLWWPDGADEPIRLRRQGGLVLHDSSEREGGAVVVFTSSPFDASEPTILLDELALDTTSTRTVGVVGDAERSTISVAALDDGYVLIGRQNRCETVEVIDETGEPRATTVPDPVCGPDASLTVVGGVADSDHYVVAREIADPEPRVELLVVDPRQPTIEVLVLPDPVGPVTGVDADENWIAVAAGGRLHLVDRSAGTVTDLGHGARSVELSPTTPAP